MSDTNRGAAIWTGVFWKDAVERAIRTTAQIMAALTISAGTGLLDTDWLASLSAAGMAGLLSILTSLAGEVRSPNGTASLVSPPPPPPEPGPEPPPAAPAHAARADGTTRTLDRPDG
jgi:hypothetical protein